MKLYLVCCFLIVSVNVFADSCNYTTSVPALSYYVDDTNATTPGTVTVARSGSGDSKCSNFFFAFTKGWAGNYNRRATNLQNGNFIYYNLYKNSNSTGVLKEPSDITSSNEVIFTSINKDEVKNFYYYFTLAAFGSSPPAAGNYYDNVQVQGYSGTYTNINAFEGYKDLNIYIYVSKFISISLVDNGGAHDPSQTSKTLDFGELETGKEIDFDMRVVSNAGYSVKVSSSNNGILKRADGIGTTSQIGYSFFANGSLKSLGSSANSPVSIASGTGITTSQGVQIPIRVVIGTVDTTKESGTYQDYITVTTTTTD